MKFLMQPMRPTRLTLAVHCALLLMVSNTAMAASSSSGRDEALEVTFDPNMLSSPHSTVDISRFASGNPVYAGTRVMSLTVNDRAIGRASVRFASPAPDVDATACIDVALLETLGVRADRWQTPPVDATMQADTCHALAQWLPNARLALEDGEHRLDFYIAQADLRDSLPETWGSDSWDRSVNGASLNYALNTYRTGGNGRQDYERTFLQLDAGVRLGRWQLRHRSTQSWDNGARRGEVLAAYAETAVPSLGANLTLGNFHSNGQLFDSIGLRGFRLQSDERMLPDSQRGYAPVVRGTARSNALVTIEQNGAVIREMSVPAGEFEIRDLYPSGFGGDLNVTVTEADGHQERFSVPYASVVQMLREGANRFSASAGRWQDGVSHYMPWVTQFTWQHGWNNWLTYYLGAQHSQDIKNVLLGSAINTGIGAIALDGSFARAQLPSGRTDRGHSVRLSYSNFLPATRTSLMVAAHRYASEGFWSLHDLVGEYNGHALDWATELERTRHRFDVRIEQPLGRGTLYATASARNYWETRREDQYVQLGYSRTFKHFGLNLAARRTHSATSEDSQFTMSASVPLNHGARSSNRLYTQATYGGGHGQQTQASLYGSAGSRHQWSYGASAIQSRGSDTVQGALNAGYQGAYANVAATYGLGDEKQASLNVAGGLLVHPGGITAGQAMSETVGIVHAPDAEGARMLSAAGVKVDGRGYAVLPSLSPYRRNTVAIDSSSVSPDVQFNATAQDIVPRAGAIVPVRFETSRATSWLLLAQDTRGEPLPLGTEILDAQGAVLGTVDRGGYAYIRGEPMSGALSARWGKHESERCELAGGRPETALPAAMAHAQTRCVGNQEET